MVYNFQFTSFSIIFKQIQATMNKVNSWKIIGTWIFLICLEWVNNSWARSSSVEEMPITLCHYVWYFNDYEIISGNHWVTEWTKWPRNIYLASCQLSWQPERDLSMSLKVILQSNGSPRSRWSASRPSWAGRRSTETERPSTTTKAAPGRVWRRSCPYWCCSRCCPPSWIIRLSWNAKTEFRWFSF